MTRQPSTLFPAYERSPKSLEKHNKTDSFSYTKKHEGLAVETDAFAGHQLTGMGMTQGICSRN